jgi:hypothetical protein
MTYREWNDLIARRFFHDGQAGKKVFLSVDDALLEELGGPAAKSDFVAAVKAGPSTARRPGLSLCTRARNTYEEWRTRSSNFPAYLAYLAFFVLAASQEGESGHEGYYKRLHRLLGEAPSNRPPPNFYEMWGLWDDLEQWANDENGGRLGIVNCDFAHTWPHVGLPRAQIVLTDRERTNLSGIFAAAELDPVAPPAAEEMALLCRRFGAGKIEARTIRRLAREGPVDEELRALTLEAILDELRSWNGTANDTNGTTADYHTLRINLRIKDRLAGIADSRLVVQDSPNFPDGEFEASTPTSAEPFRLGRCNATWLVLKSPTGTAIDAAKEAWVGGLRLSYDRIRLRLPHRRVRVLRRGESDRIEGLIEIYRLDPHREFYVLAEAESLPIVSAWATRAARNWQEIVLRSGLAPEWRLFRADGADPSIESPAEFPVLRSDPLIRILLVGGIKSEPTGRRFFEFTPPKVQLEGLPKGSSVRFNRTTRVADAGDMLLTPDLSELDTSNRVSVLVNDEEHRFVSFQILPTKEILWRRAAQSASLADGSPTLPMPGRPRADGAAVYDFIPPPLVLAPERGADLIGARPGQIACIPDEAIPSDWSPVWMIEHGRSNRRVTFCGSAPEQCVPMKQPMGDQRKVRSWRRVLWNERMRLAPPCRGPLASLWREYKEVARNG